MTQFLREAGPIVFPVLLLGAMALVISIQYMRSLKPSLFPLAVGSTVGTVILGAPATVTGFQYSVSSLAAVEPAQRWVYLVEEPHHPIDSGERGGGASSHTLPSPYLTRLLPSRRAKAWAMGKKRAPKKKQGLGVLPLGTHTK